MDPQNTSQTSSVSSSVGEPSSGNIFTEVPTGISTSPSFEGFSSQMAALLTPLDPTVVESIAVTPDDVSVNEKITEGSLLGDQEMTPPEDTTKHTIIENLTPPIDNRLARLLAADRSYNAMMRTTDMSSLRMMMSFRLTCAVFLLWLLTVWFTQERIVLFGFDNHMITGRIRDALFLLFVGMFVVTVIRSSLFTRLGSVGKMSLVIGGCVVWISAAVMIYIF